MRRRRPLPVLFLPVLAFLLAWAWVQPAMAQGCRVRISEISRIEPNTDYDPLGSDPPEYHRFTVRHQNGPACAFVVGVDDGANGDRVMSGGKGLLDYELYKDAALTQRLSDASGVESGLFSGFVDSKDRDEVEFQFFSRIIPGQMAPKGTYNDQLRFSVYELRDGVPVGPIASHPVQVRAKVREVVQAAVVVNGSRRPLRGAIGTVDLGNLLEGGRGSFDLELLGNGEYDLALESENVGRLMAPGIPVGIPYRMSVNGRAVSLSGPVVIRLDGTGLQRHQVQVAVDGVDGVLAGTYKDNLILTVMAR